MRRFRTLIAVILLFWTGLITAAPIIQVADDEDKIVNLNKPAQRIISLAPHVTELLYDVGAGDQVVGVVDYSDYPSEAKSKPIIGSYNSLNIEAIIKLNPDLIIAYSGGNPEQQLKLLQSLGIPVYFSNPPDIPAIIDALRKFGRMTGHSDRSKKRANELQQRYDSLVGQYAGLNAVSIFVEIWHNPLMTVNSHHIIGQVVSLCGGKNLFAEVQPKFPQVSFESVLAGDPQTILQMKSHGSEKNDFLDESGWNSLRAVKNNQIIYINPDILSRASARLLDGTEELCQKLDNVRSFYGNRPAIASSPQT